MKRLLVVVCYLLPMSVFSQVESLQPTSTTGDIHNNNYFSFSYSEEHEQSEWVYYYLDKPMIETQMERTNDFRPDPKVTSGTANNNDYKGSGLDRGHLAPAGDMRLNYTSMSESFYYSNMSPQYPSFNRGIWKKLERQTRDWAIQKEGLYVVTGGVLDTYSGTIGINEISIPNSYYKVLFDDKTNSIIAFVLPNKKCSNQLYEFVVTVDFVETKTGIDFFPQLPDSIESIIESSVTSNNWDFDVNTSTISSNGNDKQTTSTSTRCNGTAKSTGVRCKSKTKNTNGYCHNHQSQSPY